MICNDSSCLVRTNTVVHSSPIVFAIFSCLAITSYGMPVTAQTVAPAQPAPPPNIPSPEEQSLPSPETIPEEVPSSPEEVQIEIEQPSVNPPNVLNLDVCPPLAETSELSFLATEIRVVGNTVLADQIAKQVDCYLGQEIRLSDLFNLRSRITKLYLDEGYITSGAFVPNNQDLTNGSVEIQVIEGEIEELQINGLDRLRKGYVSDRLARAMESPFRQQDLERGLQLLQVDPMLQRVNAELTAGNGPGKSLLILDLEEADTFGLSFAGDNYRSPSIGSEGINVGLSVSHPLGIGERFNASYGRTEGLDLYDVSYSVPVNAQDGTLRLRASNSDSRIVQDAFRDIDIRSETTTLSAGFRQPLVRTPSEEFALGLDFDWKRSRSFILDDIPFSFSLGPEDGRSQVSAVRFYQDWVKRSQSQVLAARSQFSVGLDLFDATVNDSGIDGRFFSWLGQFQWIKQVSPRFLMLTRVGAQLTPDALLPIERFSLGGISTIRGYSQNQIVTDNALTSSIELRIPITKDPNKVQLTPFFEAGVGWNNEIPDPDPAFLASLGLGVRWAVSPWLSMRLDYGIPLVDVDNTGDSLQEDGLYFLLDYRPQF
ncbi:ShlB/FhaC/HecB family hemolysin secretion/activation protein [Leptolyngbyaceae cyanobacterium CCMR0082]|uniref:ShlB/FhaC/HecB family hemolysin secretion/activation protein n=2 Tax=Adonisia TaxID=2950183 RepID=A0A6M0SIC2_9CYAN|nr:ShlB/FhaC/HecB family hemolysin secretion/activation protein [Adonisia turfae CCMR0082]